MMLQLRATSTFLALCLSLAGCSRIEQAAMPVTDKINAAYPVSSEVRLAQERLHTMLADDAKATEIVDAQTQSRMTLRALTCAKNASIGRFDSVDSVKSIAMDRLCFQSQDYELLVFYGIRSVGVLLNKPALRPLKAGGQVAMLPRGTLQQIRSGALARDASVGLLSDESGGLVIAEVPGGTPIAQIRYAGQVDEFSKTISPNGRVAAFNPMGHGPVFIDTETGEKILSVAPKHAILFLGWLSQVNGFLMQGSSDSTAILADGLLGSLTPHPLSIRGGWRNAIIQSKGQPERLLMGTDRDLVLVEHTRAASGADGVGEIRASEVKRYTIGQESRISSTNPVPMRDGRMVVYVAQRNIGWLDLQTGSTGFWSMAPAFGIRFSKLDETHIMIDSIDQKSRMSKMPWSFDLINETAAPIKQADLLGTMVNIGDRVGYMRAGNEAWFGNTVTTGEAKPLEDIVSEYNLQLQLAKLQVQADAQGQGTAMVGGIESGYLTGPVPGMGNVPTNAQVHIVGVYEGGGKGAATAKKGASDGHPMRDVRIVVQSSSRPVVLVLAAYEPINWIVTNRGAQISAVLLSGYHPSLVNGVGQATVLRIGSTYAYSPTSREYGQLRQAVIPYIGAREVRSFQGAYSGEEFSVGGK